MSERQAVTIPEAILDRIRSVGNVVLLTHVHPDGDALGSTFGFAEILGELGKDVFVFLEEPVTYLYQFLPGQEKVSTSLVQLQEFVDSAGDDLVIFSLDAGDRFRLGKHHDKLLEMGEVICIDHHRSHKDFGSKRWVEPELSSTGEMVYEMALALGAAITFNGAVNLYVAICTDTGSFKYENTQPRTMRICAELIELGVRPEEMARQLYENVSLARLNLLQRVLATLEIHCGGQVGVVNVTSEMISDTGATAEDIEGFVDYPRTLDQVKVAVFIKETSEEKISVSLRAKGQCDVSKVADCFNGGGHRNAAGCRFRGQTLADVRQAVLGAIGKEIDC